MDYEPVITEDEDEGDILPHMPMSQISEPREEDENNETIGDIDTPYELDNIPLKAILAKHIEERNPEEIIIEGENKVVDKQTRNTDETIITSIKNINVKKLISGFFQSIQRRRDNYTLC